MQLLHELAGAGCARNNPFKPIGCLAVDASVVGDWRDVVAAQVVHVVTAHRSHDISQTTTRNFYSFTVAYSWLLNICMQGIATSVEFKSEVHSF